MSLAIIIPYYNINYFDKTLFSLACQTDNRFKVYIGNNNSPDDPVKLLEKYNDKLYIVYKKFNNERDPITLSEQFLQCVSMISDEEWFMILGDDDILEPEVIADFYRHLPQINKNQINVVKYSTILIDMDDNLISTIYKHNQIENSTDLCVKKTINRSRSSLSEHIFRSSQFAIHKIPHYPLAWHTDDMMILKYSNFEKIYCISDSLIIIRISGENISSWVKKRDKEKKEASIIFYTELLTEYKEKFSFEDLKIFFRLLVFITLSNYKPSILLQKIKIGRKLFGTIYANKIISNIKYPVKFKVDHDDIETFVDNFYINTFCLYNKTKSSEETFRDKKEFQVSWIKSVASLPAISRKKLNWILTRSILDEDDVIIICFDKHRFSTNYSKYELLKYIQMAHFYRADVLFCNDAKIDFKCKIQDRLYWVNNVKESTFIVLYRDFFDKLLDIDNHFSKSFPEIISSLSADKLFLL